MRTVITVMSLLTLDTTGQVGTHCKCSDGSRHCIRDERRQCRRTLEVLAHSEVMQDVERSLRHDRRKNRRMLKRMFRRWMKEGMERDRREKM